MFLHKSSQSLDILTEAKLQRRFRSSASDLERHYTGLYLIELLNLLTEEADPHEDLFDAAVSAIEAIDSDGLDDLKNLDDGTTRSSPKDTLIHFELRTLDLLGHLPMMTHCVDCGREKTTISQVHFGLNRGGIICQNCRPGKSNIISLSSEGLELMLKLTKKKLHRDTQGDSGEEQNHLKDVSNQPGYGDVRQLINKYITHLIGYPPRLHQFLGSLSN